MPFAIAEQFIIAKPRRTRLFYRLLKTSYYSERNYGSSMEEGTQRAGEYSNNDIYFNAGTYAMNGGRGQDTSKQKTYSRLSIYYLHTLSQFYLSDKAPQLSCKENPRKGKGRTGPIGLYCSAEL